MFEAKQNHPLVQTAPSAHTVLQPIAPTYKLALTKNGARMQV